MTLQHCPKPIHFIDLAAQQARIREAIDAAIRRVLDHGQYIMGPEIRELERRLADFCGTKHVLTCSNGTDAIVLALMTAGVGQGDCVIAPSFTFCATAEAVCSIGGVPLFVDVDRDTFCMSSESLKAGIIRAKRLDLPLKGVITVDLFGQPCDYDAIEPIARENGITLICDAAQAFGAAYKGRSVGSIGDIATTSFFPAKPLGCYGDGGALFTADDRTAEFVSSIRVHGQGSDKYDNVRLGMNARLDTMQAAILLAKLEIFAGEIRSRQAVAARYNDGLRGVVEVPRVADGASSVWAQYTLRSPRRAHLASFLKERGVPTALYYPKGLHQQTAYASYPTATEGLPVTEELARTCLSLPMHPYLEPADQDQIVGLVREALS